MTLSSPALSNNMFSSLTSLEDEDQEKTLIIDVDPQLDFLTLLGKKNPTEKIGRTVHQNKKNAMKISNGWMW